MSGRPKALLVLGDDEQTRLERMAARPDLPPALALRARIVLACARGADNLTVAAAERVTPQTVSKWRARFVALRLDGLADAPRPGAPHSIDDARVEAVVARTLTPPPDGAARWTTRSLAREMGLSQTAVSRIWRAFGVQPQRQPAAAGPPVDPAFAARLRDIVGLYLDRPVRALVLCVDATGAVQASAPNGALPPAPAPGAVEPRLPGASRHGATTLFAALDAAAGSPHGEVRRRQHAPALLAFLRSVEAGVPPQLDLHLLMSDRGTHRTPVVKAWLARQPRFHVHRLPTSAAWLDAVERCSATLIETYIGRGTYRPTRQLEQAIRQHLVLDQAAGAPFVWAKPAADTLASIDRLRMRMNKSRT